jgi:hypothetical protein
VKKEVEVVEHKLQKQMTICGILVIDALGEV